MIFLRLVDDTRQFSGRLLFRGLVMSFIFVPAFVLAAWLCLAQSARAATVDGEAACPEPLRDWQGESLSPKEWGERLKGVEFALPVKNLRSDAEHPQEHPAQKHPAQKHPVVALTLDACSGLRGGNCDASILDFLEERGIPATVFVTPSWAKWNPDCFARIVNNPLFELGSHGLRHRPASVNGREAHGIKGTASPSELCEEVVTGARILEAMSGEADASGKGRVIRWFRSGTAFYDELAISFIRRAGFRVAGYSVTLDQGATLGKNEVAKRVLSARGGDILLAHMHKPGGGTGRGLTEALPRLLEKGFVFVRLSDFNTDSIRAYP